MQKSQKQEGPKTISLALHIDPREALLHELLIRSAGLGFRVGIIIQLQAGQTLQQAIIRLPQLPNPESITIFTHETQTSNGKLHPSSEEPTYARISECAIDM